MPVSDKVDYDRGVIINVHPITNMDVFMYADEPGVFLSAHGVPLSDTIAAQAGFDVEALGKERVRRERKKAATEAIDKELNDDKKTVEEEVEERNGYKIVSIGLGRHHLVDPEGNRLTNSPLPLEGAEKVLTALAGEKATEFKGTATGGTGNPSQVKQTEKNAK